MNVVTQEHFAEVAHARWLPSAQAQPEKRFRYETILETGLVPDALIRASIRKLLRQRLRAEDRGSKAANPGHLSRVVEHMKHSPIALRPDSAQRPTLRSPCGLL
jgi:cyclopropane-fatty-acyl-phospholipid synthase